MSQWIDGVHHIALKPTTAEQYEKTVEFYTQLLGFEVKKSWETPSALFCLMVSCGDNSCMEILNGEEPAAKGGALDHSLFCHQPGGRAGGQVSARPGMRLP